MTLLLVFMISKVGVMTSQKTELPTKIGRLYMKRLYWQHLILTGTLAFSLEACVHKPTKTMKADIPIETPAALPPHMVLLREARSEAANMRAELASLKILMAKQAGEIRSLRARSQSVYHREQDQGTELQNIRSQLLSSQAEREQLRKHNLVLESQVVSMPDTSQLISDLQSLQGSFQQIMGNMKGLASDMKLIKQEMHIPKKTPTPRRTKMTTSSLTGGSAATHTPDGTPGLDAKGQIIIQDGDTLWELSQTYLVSVQQLMDWNSLTSDLILTGFPLKISDPSEAREEPLRQVNVPIDIIVPKSPVQRVEHEVHENPQPAMDAHVKIPSEPKHILAIGSPQLDSHESP